MDEEKINFLEDNLITENQITSNSENYLDIIISLREKNNNLLINLQEYNKSLAENKMFKKKLSEIEFSFNFLQQENEKLIKKIEEYQLSNKTWESKVKDINTLLMKLEEKNNILKNENFELIKQNENFEFQIKIYREKENDHDNHYEEIKKFQIEYEKLIQDLKIKRNGMRNKEYYYKEELERYQFAVAQYEKNLEEIVKENVLLKEKLNKAEKFVLIKEREFNEIKIMKEKEIKVIQNSLRQISLEYEEEVNSMKKTMEFFKGKLISSEDNQIKEKKMQLVIKEKDDVIKKLSIEISELKNIKNNCFNLIQGINF